MADLSEMLAKANKQVNKTASTQAVQGATVILEKTEGAKAQFSFHRDENDSPTSLFTDSGVEASTTQSITRLMNLWQDQNKEREKNCSTPEDYISNANKIFKTYQGIRFKLDSSIAFLIGDMLNECKARFFSEEKKEGKRWVDFLKEEISFSVRQAYDFMSISNRLQDLKDKVLSMEQLRALLILHSSGFDLHKIPQNVENMLPGDILDLKKLLPSLEVAPVRPSCIQQLSRMMAVTTKLEQMTLDLESVFKSNPDFSMSNLNKREKDHISSLKVKLESILSLINK